MWFTMYIGSLTKIHQNTMFSVTDTGIKELEDNANGFITNSEQENSTHYFYLSR